MGRWRGPSGDARVCQTYVACKAAPLSHGGDDTPAHGPEGRSHMFSGNWLQWVLFGFFAGIGFVLGQAVLNFAAGLARGYGK